MKLTGEKLREMGYVETVPGCFKKGNSLRISSDCYGVPREPQPAPKRIRQSSKPLMNKLEAEWLSVLQQQCGAIIYAQSMRFKLANGIWYKPDFVVFYVQSVTAYECKGPHAFRGGFENLKVAAHQYPNIRWSLIWKENNQWKEQTVLP